MLQHILFFHNNKDFQRSLIVALLKGTVAKAKDGNDTEMDKMVVNFYRFMRTYDKKASEVLSANLAGPLD